MNFPHLFQECLRMLVDCDFSQRERTVAQRIIELSFGMGLRSVLLLQRDLIDITGLDEAAVSKAVSSLIGHGVLQVIGQRNQARQFRWLPNGHLLPPPVRVDPVKASAAMARIRGYNRFGDGVEITGQIPLPIRTIEENLDDDFAAASVVLDDGANNHPLPTVSGERWDDPEWVSAKARESLGGTPSSRGTGNAVFSDARGAADGGFPDAFPSAPTCQFGKLRTHELAEMASSSPGNLSNRQDAPSSAVGTNAPAYVGACARPSGSGRSDLRSTGTRTPGASVAVADDDLLQEIKEFIGSSEWSGTARFGRTWISSLRKKPWSRRAAMTALGELKIAKASGFTPDKSWGRCLWGTFRRIESEMAPDS